MATITKALLDLLTNPKTRKFAESLKHSDLPTGWADDPEIVDLAAKAWQEAGKESPFFRAYEKVMGPTSIGYHATGAKFNEFKYKPIKHGNNLGPGFYFGDNEMANHFLPERNGKIIEAYLASKNPYTPNVENHARVLENMFDATNTTRVKDGVPPLPESKRSSWYQGQRDDFAKKMMDFPRIANMQAIEFAADNQEILKALGFDSILSGKERVMWDPRQIKSTINRGTFNPADPNIYRTLAPLGVGTAAMAAALLGDGSEAEAMPRPQYMIELLNQLKNGDFHSMAFGQLKGKQLRKAQKIDPSFTKGPVKLSAKNIEKFDDKRIGSDGLTPEEFVDGLNRSLFNTRNHAFPNKGGAKFYLPGEEHTWTGVVAPHDGFSGLVTGYKIKNKDAKKELQSLSEGRPSPSGHSLAGGSARPGRLTAVESEPKPVEGTVSEAVSSVNKKVIPAALLASALGGDAAQAIESNEPSASSGGNLRALGIGARDVLEGLGEGVGFVANPFANLLNAAAGGSPTYFSEANAGRALADLLGLPAAESDAEKFLGGISRGAASVLPTMGAGVALNAAKAAPLLANDLLASPRMQAAFGAGIGGFDQALRYLLDGD